MTDLRNSRKIEKFRYGKDQVIGYDTEKDQVEIADPSEFGFVKTKLTDVLYILSYEGSVWMIPCSKSKEISELTPWLKLSQSSDTSDNKVSSLLHLSTYD